jgi:NADH-quinone oxidoreductase subunit C
MTDLSTCETRVRERFPELVFEAVAGIDCGVLIVQPDDLTGVMTLLKEDLGFEMLVDITGVDWLEREPRYDVNYHLLSLRDCSRLRVKVQLPDVETPRVPSVTELWAGADWMEREVFDFFGVIFTGHPNLRRILMPDEWIGHPLRKDYPVGGVPVEYRIEPAYVGEGVEPPQARPAAGGVPARLRRDRGRLSHWTWTGPPASGVEPREPAAGHELSEEGKEE